MNCNDIRYRLPEYLQGNIVDQDFQIIAEHLTSCAACRQETELLRECFASIKDETPWIPDKTYWASVLPKVHSRIEIKSKDFLPTWVSRFALPVSAAIVLIVSLIEIIPTSDDQNTFQIDQSMFSQVPKDELQDFIEQQSIVGIAASTDINDNDSVFEDDEIILRNLFQDKKYTLADVEPEQEALLDNINDKDADAIVSILKTHYHTIIN